jgi:hypothetical protein
MLGQFRHGHPHLRVVRRRAGDAGACITVKGA